MKLSISQPGLLAVVARGASAAPKSSPSPIVTHVRLTATGSFLLVASTDMDRYAEARTLAAVENEGDITVPAAALAALVARLPKDKDVALEIEGAHLIVKCGRSRSKLPTLPSDLFPSWIDTDGAATFTMRVADFAEAFSTVRPMTNPAGLTYVMLQGIHATVSPSLGLRVAATNRNFAAVQTLPFDEAAANMPDVTIPNETIDAAIRMFRGEEEVTISVGTNKVDFSNHAYRLGSKLIAEAFPMSALDTVFGSESVAILKVNRAELAEAVERARLGAEAEGALSVVILIPRGEELEVKGYNNTGGEVRDAVEAEIGDGFEFAAFDPRYLSTMLSTVPGDVVEIRQTLTARGERINHLFSSPDHADFAGLVAAVRSNAVMAQ